MKFESFGALDDRDADGPIRWCGLLFFQRNRILIVNAELVDMRHDAFSTGLPVFSSRKSMAGVNSDTSREFADDQPLDEGTLILIQQLKRTGQVKPVHRRVDIRNGAGPAPAGISPPAY